MVCLSRSCRVRVTWLFASSCWLAEFLTKKFRQKFGIKIIWKCLLTIQPNYPTINLWQAWLCTIHLVFECVACTGPWLADTIFCCSGNFYEWITTICDVSSVWNISWDTLLKGLQLTDIKVVAQKVCPNHQICSIFALQVCLHIALRRSASTSWSVKNIRNLLFLNMAHQTYGKSVYTTLTSFSTEFICSVNLMHSSLLLVASFSASSRRLLTSLSSLLSLVTSCNHNNDYVRQWLGNNS